MHIDTKLTEVPELHLYPAVDKYRKRKLMQDNATENVTWRVQIWYRKCRASILLSIHADFIDVDHNIVYIRIQFSEKTITEI